MYLVHAVYGKVHTARSVQGRQYPLGATLVRCSNSMFLRAVARLVAISHGRIRLQWIGQMQRTELMYIMSIYEPNNIVG